MLKSGLSHMNDYTTHAPQFQISVRLTKEEKKRLQQEAHSYHLSVSTYIRFKLFNLIK